MKNLFIFFSILSIILSCSSDDSNDSVNPVDPIFDSDSAFITTWRVDAGEMIRIPINPDLSGYNYTVDWGDGTTATFGQEDATHTYAEADLYTVRLTGDFPAIMSATDFRLIKIFFNYILNIRSVENWGDIAWQSMEAAFAGVDTLFINLSSINKKRVD